MKASRFRYFTYIAPVLKVPFVKSYGSFILTISALIIFIVFAIKPTIETILVLQKELENQKQVLSKIEKKSEDLSQANKNYQSLNPEVISKIQNAVPQKTELQSLVRSLESTVLGTQASISALQFQPITIEPTSTFTSKPIPVEILFNFNVEGSYAVLSEVLDDLKNSGRLITIDNIIFSKLEGSNLLLSVKGKVYYLK